MLNIVTIFSKSQRFIVFCLVGLLSSFLDLLVLYILNLYIFDYLYISVTLAFIAGLVVNYIFHTKITFGTSLEKSNAIKFMSVVLFNYFLTVSVIEISVFAFSLNVVIAKVISLPIIAVSGFLLSKHWVYK